LFTACGEEDNGSLSLDYNPQISPLPSRTPKPLEEWGVDNGDTIISHTFSVFSDPMYPPDFEHFDYVNPDAPKGGTLRLAGFGTFDSFNRYAERGDMDTFAGSINLRLMTPSSDEIDALYPLIAEKIEYAKDFSYVIFHINKDAVYQDGVDIKAEDVKYSFNKFFTEGVSQFAITFSVVDEVTVLDEHRVRFDLAEPSRDMIFRLANSTVLPPHFWEDKDLGEPQQVPVLGSSPWSVGDYDMGQRITYEIDHDHWSMNLPVNIGTSNYERIEIEYYKDEAVLLEAFRSAEYDFRYEGVSKDWVTRYEGPNFDAGVLIKAPFFDPQPPGQAGEVFNVQREPFQDRRVRKALSYALDFETMNKTLFYDLYTRSSTYFAGTAFGATGLPEGRELEILEEFRDQLPPEVFTEEFTLPVYDGTGSIREGMEQAFDLLEEAGWELRDGVMTNTQTGEPMRFEYMMRRASEERVVLPFKDNLEKMGIDLVLDLVDTTQFIERLRDGIYDMHNLAYSQLLYPSGSMSIVFHSKNVDSSWNSSRIEDPVIDALVDGAIENLDNKAELVHWGRAFDRVMAWNYYVIPRWHLQEHWIAHVDKFGKPDVWPKYDSGRYAWDYWWIDEEKAAQLPENLR
jgi:microcin C transport system substrate-binding protein